jgi:hypothetical protein
MFQILSLLKTMESFKILAMLRTGMFKIQAMPIKGIINLSIPKFSILVVHMAQEIIKTPSLK